MYVHFARAVYSKADIYLLDDPLSAVDVRVAQLIMEDCILGLLKERCAILVTHQVKYLANIPKVIYLSEDSAADEKNLVGTEQIPTIDDLVTVTHEDDWKINSPEWEHSAVPESRSMGFISLQVWARYMRAGSTVWSLLLTLLLFIACQFFLSASDMWLKTW